MNKQERIEGFDIPLRELTEEEASRSITLERFKDFHYEVGEDFVDQIGSVNTKTFALIFAGFAMAKHPEWSIEILSKCNNALTEVYTQLILDVYEENTSDDDQGDTFYSDLAEFLNLTINAKKRVNQVLIQVAEYYS